MLDKGHPDKRSEIAWASVKRRVWRTHVAPLGLLAYATARKITEDLLSRHSKIVAHE